jgi:hypothetical protein
MTTTRTRIARRLRAIADRFDPDTAPAQVYIYGAGPADEPGVFWLGPDGTRPPAEAPTR